MRRAQINIAREYAREDIVDLLGNSTLVTHHILTYHAQEE